MKAGCTTYTNATHVQSKAVRIIVLLLAACVFAYGNVPLSGNSPLGHRSSAPLAYQAIGQANSFTASGLRACLCDEGRRSRSTSKERVAETGLDYFGARYVSGAQGRFQRGLGSFYLQVVARTSPFRRTATEECKPLSNWLRFAHPPRSADWVRSAKSHQLR